jgi:FkbM family methyltransferase
MFMNPLLTPLALVWGRLELPKWRWIVNRVAGWDPYPGAPIKRIRGKVHGLLMDLDLSDWSDRWAYFLGRYYESHTQSLFQAALRPGDVFVDVGANIGMTTLCAAALVGPDGRVIAFEPNPRVFDRLRGHVELNGLERLVELRHCGLSEQPGQFELHVPIHAGEASFAVPQGAGPVVVHSVPVSVGDDELGRIDMLPMFIKIDVEGFEYRVLCGLRQTLATRQPAVLTEALDVHLARAGSSVEQLFKLMVGLGYTAYSVSCIDPVWGWPGRLTLHHLESARKDLSQDLLWLATGSPFQERLSQHMS